MPNLSGGGKTKRESTKKELTMDKAIDTLELLREYLEDEVRSSCEYYIYSNLIDITDKAIAELEAKDEYIAELGAKLKNMCAECECAKFADNAIKPSKCGSYI